MDEVIEKQANVKHMRDVKNLNFYFLPPFYCSSFLAWFVFGTGVDTS